MLPQPQKHGYQCLCQPQYSSVLAGTDQHSLKGSDHFWLEKKLIANMTVETFAAVWNLALHTSKLLFQPRDHYDNKTAHTMKVYLD